MANGDDVPDLGGINSAAEALKTAAAALEAAVGGLGQTANLLESAVGGLGQTANVFESAVVTLGKTTNLLESAAKKMDSAASEEVPFGAGLGEQEEALESAAESMANSIKFSSKTLEDLLLPGRSEEVNVDQFRLTGQELYQPALVITRGMEDLLTTLAQDMNASRATGRIKDALAQVEAQIRQSVEDKLKKQFDAEIGGEKKTKEEKEQIAAKIKDAMQKWTDDEKEQAKLKAKLDKEQERRLDLHNKEFIATLGGFIRIPLAKFTNYVLSVVSKAGEHQKMALKFNKSFSSAVTEAGSRISDMPGSLEQKMKTLFEFQEAGLEAVGKNTLNLAQRMSLTGQNQKALISLEKKLLNQGGLSLSQFDALALNLDNLSRTYSMSTDLLITSLEQLDSSLDLLMATGSTDEVANALAEATAKFPSLAKELGSFAEMFATADIGQLQMLGGSFQDLEKFASGQIKTGDEYLKIVNKIGASAKRFVDVQGVVGTAAMLDVVGPLGRAAMKMEEAMSGGGAQRQWDEVGNTANRIMSSWEIAMNTLLAGFEDTITTIITYLQTLGEQLVRWDEYVKGSIFSFLRVEHVMGTLLVGTILKKVLPALNSLAWGAGKTGGVKMYGTWMEFLTKKMAVAGLGMGMKIGLGLVRFLSGPLGIAMIIWGLLNWLNNKKEEDKEGPDKETAKNTARLVEIARDRERLEFGASRFERLTQKLIQDSLFSQAAQESLLARGLPELLENTRMTAAHTATPAKVEYNVPVR